MQGSNGNPPNVTIRFSLDLGNLTAEAKKAGEDAARVFSTAFAGAANIAPGLGHNQPSGTGGAGTGLGLNLTQNNVTDLGTSIGKSLGQSISDSLTKSLTEELRTQRGGPLDLNARAGARPAREELSGVAGVVSSLNTAIQGIATVRAFMSGDPFGALFATSTPFFENILKRLAGPGERREEQGRRPGGGIELPARLAARELRLDPTWPRAARGAGAAAEEVAGAARLGGGLSTAAGVALRAAPAVYAGVEGVRAVAGVGEQLLKTSEGAAKLAVDWDHMAKTIGLSTQDLLKMRLQFAEAGLDIDNFARGLQRIAITSQRDLPEATRRYEESFDNIAEANIKVRETGRGVTETQIAQGEAADNLTKANLELEKVQTTGEEQRRERLQQARLGVTGAAVGQWQAQAGLAQALIRQRLAPEEERLQEIAAPLTTRGAQLGLRAAQIAQDKSRGLDTRQAERELRADTLQHNVEQAQLRLQQAQLQEEQQTRLQRAGLGPRGQAAIGVAQAEQASQEADLRRATAQTNLTNTQLEQRRISLNMQEDAARRERDKAALAVPGALDAAERARIAERGARRDVPFVELRQPARLEQAIGNIETGQPEQLDPSQVTFPAQTIRDFILTQAARQPGGPTGVGIQDALARYLRAAVPDENAPTAEARGEEALLGLGLGLRQLGGPAQAPRILRTLRTPFAERPLTPENAELAARMAPAITAALPAARALEPQAAVRQAREDMLNLQEDLKTLAAGKPLGALVATTNEANIQIKGAFNSIATGIVTSGSSVIQALNAAAAKLVAFAPGGAKAEGASAEGAPAGGTPAEGAPAGGAPAEGAAPAPTGTPSSIGSILGSFAPGAYPGLQTGGLITGPGSETSDSIPIMAANGEYIIKASRVRQLGLPFLDTLNRKGMQDGGEVTDSGSETSDSTARAPAAPTYKNLSDVRVDQGGTSGYEDVPKGRPIVRLGDWYRLSPSDQARSQPVGWPVDTKEGGIKSTRGLTITHLGGGRDDISATEDGTSPGVTPSAGPTIFHGTDRPTLGATAFQGPGVTPSAGPTIFHGTGIRAGTTERSGPGVTVFHGTDLLTPEARREETRRTTNLQTGVQTLDAKELEGATTTPYPGNPRLRLATLKSGRQVILAADPGSNPPTFNAHLIVPWAQILRGRAGGGPTGGVPIMASNGEYRMGADAVDHYGPGFFETLNRGTIRMQAGGSVGALMNFAAAVAGQALNAPLGATISAVPSRGQYDTFIRGLAEYQRAGQPITALGIRTPQPSLASLGIDISKFTTPGPTEEQRGLASRLTDAYSNLGLSGENLTRLPASAVPTPTAGYSLDLRTSAGNFTVTAQPDVLESIRTSAIGSSLSSAGTRPSWYS